MLVLVPCIIIKKLLLASNNGVNFNKASRLAIFILDMWRYTLLNSILRFPKLIFKRIIVIDLTLDFVYRLVTRDFE